ncbi:hypothetical protein KR222_003947 [Zaprionus bogoriensis]|nr:hypothetical protein KR222_003947 [Zaprionus bogoriensis]
MWEQLERYRNHYLQREIQDVMKPSSINCLQGKEWNKRMSKRDFCKQYPRRCPESSTYFEDRTQLAFGWYALPKLIHEMDSDIALTHWRAIVSLRDFLLNPLNAQRAIIEMELVRKVKNAFLRMRFKFHESHYNEEEMYLKIFDILSRNLNGAEHIAKRKCLMIEFYKIVKQKAPVKEDLAAEILRNLTGKPKVLGIVLADKDNFVSLAKIFKQDPCKHFYPPHLWHHLCHLLELAPEQAIELGFFELLHARVANRLPLYWDQASKALALLLRCAEGQRRFDEIDGIRLIYEIFEDVYRKSSERLPLQKVESYEYIVLMLLNGLHSKRALWRSREFTMLACHVGRRMKTKTEARLQLYCLQALRELGVMPCGKRYINGNWLQEISELECLNAECECARDALVDWLRRDIAESG